MLLFLQHALWGMRHQAELSQGQLAGIVSEKLFDFVVESKPALELSVLCCRMIWRNLSANNQTMPVIPQFILSSFVQSFYLSSHYDHFYNQEYNCTNIDHPSSEQSLA